MILHEDDDPTQSSAVGEEKPRIECTQCVLLQQWGKRSQWSSAHHVEIRRWMPYYGSFESCKNSGGRRTLMILKVALILLISARVVVQVNGLVYTFCKS